MTEHQLMLGLYVFDAGILAVVAWLMFKGPKQYI